MNHQLIVVWGKEAHRPECITFDGIEIVSFKNGKSIEEGFMEALNYAADCLKREELAVGDSVNEVQH